MITFAEKFNLLLGFGVIVLQALSLFVLLLFVYSVYTRRQNNILGLISRNYVLLGFLLSFFAVLFSLIYSEILKYAPCYHCWIQRIFLIPQVFLFAVAFIKKKIDVIWYSLPLLVFGLADALYHNYLYYFKTDSIACDASGVSCTQRLVSVFDGYISIPSMSLTIFVALLVLSLVAFYYNKEK